MIAEVRSEQKLQCCGAGGSHQSFLSLHKHTYIPVGSLYCSDILMLEIM